MAYRPDIIMGLDSAGLQVAGGAQVTDEFFLMEMWKPAITTTRPYRDDAVIPMFEGGYVTALDGVNVSLNASRTRQAIDPSDGSAAYATSLTKDHSGRTVLVWNGDSVGEKARIVSNTAYGLVLDRSLLCADALLVICDEVYPESIDGNWDIDRYTAGADLTFDTVYGDPIRRMSARSLIYWRKRAWSSNRAPSGGPLLDTGWVPYGIWTCALPQDDLRNSQMPVRVTCTDMLQPTQVEPITARFQADILKQYGDNPTQESMQVLRMVQEGAGDEAFYRFFDSPAAFGDAASIMANHTVNWCPQRPVELWMSSDTNQYVTRTGGTPDLPVSLSDGTVQAYYGSGEIRITKQWYNANMSGDPGIGALALNGVDQRVDAAAYSSVFDPPKPGVMGWVKLNNYPSVGQYMSVAGVVFIPGDDAAAFAFIDDSGHLHWQSHRNYDTFNVASASPIPLDGQWHHIAAGVTDGGEAVAVWIDGVREGTTDAGDPILTTGTTGCVIGKIDQGQNSLYSYFSGAMDEWLWIFSKGGRTMLDDANVALDYNGGSGTTSHPGNIDDYMVWHFNGTIDHGAMPIGIPQFTGGLLQPTPTGRSYLKARYAKWCGDCDVREATVTSIADAGLTLVCDDLTGSLALPEVGTAPYKSVIGWSARITSGLARGAIYTIQSNTSTSITLDRSALADGVAEGDYFEIGQINDPAEVLETALLMSGYQVGDADRPMYVEPLAPALQPDSCASVQAYSGSVWTDLTADAADESVGFTTSLSSGDVLYIGHTYPYTWDYFETANSGGVEGVVREYWSGVDWIEIPSLRYVDQTALGDASFVYSGYMHWNRPSDWTTCTVNLNGPLFYTRLRGTYASQPDLTLKRVSILGRSQFKSPTQYVFKDNKKASDILQDCRSQRVLPPNWILRADFDGHIVGEAVVQQDAVWRADGATGLRHVTHESDTITACTYTGYSENIDNIAIIHRVIAAGFSPVSIEGNDTYLATKGIVPAPNNDHTHGVDGLLLGYLQVSSVPDPGGGYWGVWQYYRNGVYPGVDTAAPISQEVLWTLDLGGIADNLNEFHLYTNNDLKPTTANAHKGTQSPTLGLQVSSDGTTWYWLCNTASSLLLNPDNQNGFKDFRLTSGEAGWQSEWRYMRCLCMVAGNYVDGSTTRSYTGAVLGMKLYQNQQLTATVKLGIDAPFTADEYADRMRRYGVNQDLSSDIDYSADTYAKVRARAVARLREYSYNLPELILDVLRPDARLFDTAAVTWVQKGYVDRGFMLLSLSAQKGAQISAKVRDCTVRQVGA